MLGQRLNNYAIKRLLGEGGMSSVYEAEHALIRRSVAVKVLKSELSVDGAQVQRFFNEARAASAIRHPNIVEVIDVGRLPDGVPYLVMELLEGESLGARLASLGSLDIPLALDFAHQAASALIAAHAVNVVHRDLKPDNLFLVPDERLPDRELVKVLDFGIAKLRGDLAEAPFDTMAGTVLGTPPYMSPEQCRGLPDAIDERTDIYALGVILYEMLCGIPPFVADGAGELMLMHMTEPPEPPTRLRPEIGPEIEAVILRALAKRCDDRFATMAEFEAALAEISASFGVPAHAAQRPAPAADGVTVPALQLVRAVPAGEGDTLLGTRTEPAAESERAPAVTRALSRRAPADVASGVVALAAFEHTPALAPEVPAANIALTESQLESEVDLAADDDSQVASLPANASAESPRWVALAFVATAVAAAIGLIFIAANRWPPASETSTAAASRATPAPSLVAPVQASASRATALESSPITNTAGASEHAAAASRRAPALPRAVKGTSLRAETRTAQKSAKEPRSRRGDVSRTGPLSMSDFASPAGAAAPREPATASSQEPGYLSFDSSPWSDVFLGADRLGTTPLIRVPLPPGKHLLTLRNPELGASTSYAVEIQPGKTVARLVGWDRR